MPADRRLRIAAYAVCHDDLGRLLLARWIGPTRPLWTLPGGGLNFGEHPQLGALRELTEETGYVGEIEALLGVDVDHFLAPTGIDWHSVRIIYRVKIIGGELTYEQDGSTDLAAWLPPDEVDVLDAVPLVAAGRSVAIIDGWPVGLVEAHPPAASEFPRAARLAAYALLRDRGGRVLLVHGAPGDMWSGRWLFPGGGAEHGEDVAATVVREVAEETGLDVAVEAVLAATSDVVDSVPTQQQLWTVRLICTARLVGGSLRPEVDGSSDEARWFTRDELDRVPLVPFVREVLAANP